MHTELDPLLPDHDVSPEIISRPNPSHCQSRSGKDLEIDRDSNKKYNETTRSLLRNVIGMFIIVVGFALLITLLSPGYLSAERRAFPAPTNQTGNLTARVDKILSTTPLIGNNVRVISGNHHSETSI